MAKQFFGTDGIRGPAWTYPLDDDGMPRIGRAIASYFTEPGDPVIVGWDPRESSPGLVAGLTDGLASMGAKVRKMGVLPTPGLAYLTNKLQAEAGVMITASHNPYTDNGVKVFTPDSRKLTDEAQVALNGLIESDVPPTGPGQITEDTEALKLYEDFLVKSAGRASFAGLKLGLDSANGATSGIAGRVFGRLGADVTTMSDKPDGRNINVKCGATDPAALRAAVSAHGLDAGAAFDGDGDRLILVDGKGRELTGDHIMYILAVTGGHEGVVATIMSNQGLKTGLEKHGIKLERTPVGDRSVLEGLEKTGFTLGGEQSGHIILYDLSPTGDGLLAAINTLAAVKTSGRSLAAWRDELELLPQALLSIPFPDKRLLDTPGIKALVEEQESALGDAGRLNIRASGTEPKVRIMVEAPDAEQRAQSIADELTTIADRMKGRT